jgi:hypothetical protein
LPSGPNVIAVGKFRPEAIVSQPPEAFKRTTIPVFAVSDLLDMALGSAIRDEQLLGYLAARQPFSHQTRHLALATAEVRPSVLSVQTSHTSPAILLRHRRGRNGARPALPGHPGNPARPAGKVTIEVSS